MKVIITVVTLIASMAAAGVVSLPSPVQKTLTFSTAQYSTQYDDSDGTWYISVEPVADDDQGLRVMWVPIDYAVTSEMIANAAGLEEGQKPSEVMTGKQISDAVMAIVVQMFYELRQ